MSKKIDALKKWIAKSYKDVRLFYRNYAPSLGVGVSRIHYFEARERFFFLFELTRFQGMMFKLDLPFDKNIDDYTEIITNAKEIINNIPGNSQKAKDDKKQCYAILACYEALVASINYLNRKQGDLNRLWRTMTRVHTRLTSIITNKNKQLDQLYFCQEEAFRLGLGNDSEIKLMLQELAESIDSRGTSAPSQKYNCVLCALIERFNTIRTGRIYQQNLNVKTYLKAFIMLMIVSIILILNHDLIMNEKNNPTFINKTDHNNPVNPSNSTSLGKDIGENGQIKIKVTSPDVTGNEKNNLQTLIYAINHWFKTNMFLFVFFGGFAGGAFSLATRARKRDREHGEDVYSSVYVVTKPFIGALGAIILYILMHTSFLTQNFIENNMIESLRLPGAVTFGFSFVAGFSERLVFPQFR